MKPAYLLILALMLTGCGSAGGAETKQQGLSFNPDYKAKLKELYAEAQECTGLKGEGFEALNIEVSPSSFKCELHGTCNGLFDPPHDFRIAYAQIFLHESIHYLLWLNHGDSDSEHTSQLFRDCM